ncbi:TsaB protein, required for threonylcarbamoyladenosine (t(6)A) formation in tRNA [hydrothermal vent metagenome]|uniref:TsaB protein, required for threonylcarbamoyladenosine (T(6)A) formation in tRNA n=1 Tax=hydrothermal vent metagenome TaxID=652676 RepID=A0A1W1E9Z6_9ZZZZ
MPKATLVVLPIAAPMQIGVYGQSGMLVERIENTQKTSEVLLPMLMELLEKYDVDKIIYTRGPGSYMAIKLTYVILKTIEIVRGILCQGCSAFAFNGGKPIKAVGNLYFIKEKETIITKKFEQPVNAEFVLPQSIHDLEIDEESTPAYNLPAV